MYQNIATKVLTGEVRLSYANLTTPRAPQQGGEPKYSVTLLIILNLRGQALQL